MYSYQIIYKMFTTVCTNTLPHRISWSHLGVHLPDHLQDAYGGLYEYNSTQNQLLTLVCKGLHLPDCLKKVHASMGRPTYLRSCSSRYDSQRCMFSPSQGTCMQQFEPQLVDDGLIFRQMRRLAMTIWRQSVCLPLYRIATSNTISKLHGLSQHIVVYVPFTVPFHIIGSSHL